MNNHKVLEGWVGTGSLCCLLLLLVALADPAGAGEDSFFSPESFGGEHMPAGEQADADGNLELLGEVGGRIKTVVSDGDYLYANSGRRLLILTLEPSLKVIGEIALPATVRHVALTGETAVVVAGCCDLYTISVSDPTRPAIIGRLHLDQYEYTSIRSLLATGDTVYVRVTFDFLIVDIVSPSHPNLIGAISFEESRLGFNDPVLQGDLLLVPATGEYCVKPGLPCVTEYHLIFMDVSVPSEPVAIMTAIYYEPIATVGLREHFAFVIVGDRMGVYDVYDLADPEFLAWVSLPIDSGSVEGISFDDGIAYLFGAELLLYDMAEPTSPQLLTRLPRIKGSVLPLAGRMISVAGGCGLTLLDMSDSARPTEVDSYVAIQPGWTPPYMIVEDGVLYTAGYPPLGDNCLRLVDVSDPTTLTLLSSLAFEEPIYTFDKVGNLLFVGEPLKLSIFDVTEPSDPAPLSVVNLDLLPCADFGIGAAGDYVYVHCLNSFYGPYPLIRILDVHDPGAPSWVGEYRLPNSEEQYSIVATPGTLYLVEHFVDSDDDSEIYVVDVSDPANPHLVAAVPPWSLGALEDLILDFPNLYLRRGHIVQIVDLHDSRAPQRTHTLTFDGGFQPMSGSLAATDGIVYFLEYDLYPDNIALEGYVQAPIPYHFDFFTPCPGCGSSYSAVAAQPDLLFTGTPDSGLFAYRITLPEIHGVFLPFLSE